MIYVDLVRRSLNDLTINNSITRRELYDQLKAGLRTALNNVEPALDPVDINLEVRLLSITIIRFARDLRDGIDVYSQDYNPSELRDEQIRLYSFKRANRVTSSTTVITRSPEQLSSLVSESSEDTPSTEQIVTRLRQQMFALSRTEQWSELSCEYPFAPSTIRAVILRKLSEVSAKNSLGMLWLICEPALYITAIVGMYTYLGRADVMDMEIAPFAITGVISLLMFRQTVIRVSNTVKTDIFLLSLPPISLISVAFAQGAIIYLSFIVAAAIALAIIVFFEFGPGPVDWQQVIVIWTTMWLFAVSLGIILGFLSTYTQMITQTMSITFRFISVLSGGFFVSEQFPQEYTVYLLWNPILHGIQLLRSAYFAGYKSTDASWDFFLCCVGAIIIYAVACERMTRARVEPA